MTLTTDLADATADGQTCIVLLRDGSVICGVCSNFDGAALWSKFETWGRDGQCDWTAGPHDITRVLTAEEYAAMIAALEEEK